MLTPLLQSYSLPRSLIFNFLHSNIEYFILSANRYFKFLNRKFFRLLNSCNCRFSTAYQKKLSFDHFSACIFSNHFPPLRIRYQHSFHVRLFFQALNFVSRILSCTRFIQWTKKKSTGQHFQMCPMRRGFAGFRFYTFSFYRVFTYSVNIKEQPFRLHSTITMSTNQHNYSTAPTVSLSFQLPLGLRTGKKKFIIFSACPIIFIVAFFHPPSNFNFNVKLKLHEAKNQIVIKSLVLMKKKGENKG